MFFTCLFHASLTLKQQMMLGLHGNGLTHLLWMQPNRLSTVIEIFCPNGFAHDYHWTTRALGMTHITVWNDTWVCYPVFMWTWTQLSDSIYNNSYITHPDKPEVNYPECFQGKQIPVHGPALAQLIEDRVSSHPWWVLFLSPSRSDLGGLI
jgi:hypothetical protein